MSAIPAYRYPVATRRPRRAASLSVTVVITRAMAFSAIIAASYLTSSLVGNVMMEKARRQGITANQRARDARKAERELRQEIDAMTGLGAVSQWAQSHDFCAPERLFQPSRDRVLVASNH